MAQLPAAKRPKPIPADIKDILGPLPLLTTEDAATYDAMLSCFAADLAPEDIIAWTFVLDLCVYRVEIARYRRLKAAVIHKAYETRINKEIEHVNWDAASQRECLRKKADLDKQAAPQTIADKKELQKREADIEISLKASLARVERDRLGCVQEWQSRLATDRDLSDELDNWMNDFQKIERLQEIAEKRFTTTLRDLERYVTGFGKTLRDNLTKIIDGEVV